MAKDTNPQVASKCGIVMPISAFGDYDAKHWLEVRELLGRAIEQTDFEVAPVWEHSETDIIHGRIVRNLYEFPLAVCDISGLNANVMFELGMRLAFAKPTIVVVDDVTKIPFDTTAIEHIIYDRTLHFKSTESFVDRLKNQINKVQAAVENSKYISFLDTFGAFATFSPKADGSDGNDYVIRVLESITQQISVIRNENRAIRNALSHTPSYEAYPEPSVGVRNALMGGSRVEVGPSFWTDEKIQQLKDLWIAGLSASQIAVELGGLSRNSVIGMAHRLGLGARSALPEVE